MEGQAVTIGSSISQTGSMLVTCNKPYTLKVNGIVWSPIGSSEGTDVYVLSSSGLIEILVDGERIFFFRNSIVADFTLTGISQFIQRVGTTPNGPTSSSSSYVQTSFNSNSVDNVFMRVKHSTPVTGLSATTSQGSIAALTEEDENTFILRVQGLDPSQYCQIRVGNVLLAFVLPYGD